MGPRTVSGLTKSNQVRLKHGRFSADARREAAQLRELLRECKEMAQGIHEKLGGTGCIDDPGIQAQGNALEDLLATNGTLTGGGI